MGTIVLFDRYLLLEPAGSGGTAEVWRARDERTGEEVALKRLHPIVFGTESGRRRLVREFRALRSLRHPSVVRVRDLKFARDDALPTPTPAPRDNGKGKGEDKGNDGKGKGEGHED